MLIMEIASLLTSTEQSASHSLKKHFMIIPYLCAIILGKINGLTNIIIITRYRIISAVNDDEPWAHW